MLGFGNRWIGFTLLNVGELGNFLSYAFAPASVVAPLGTVHLHFSLTAEDRLTNGVVVRSDSELFLCAVNAEREVSQGAMFAISE